MSNFTLVVLNAYVTQKQLYDLAICPKLPLECRQKCMSSAAMNGPFRLRAQKTFYFGCEDFVLDLDISRKTKTFGKKNMNQTSIFYFFLSFKQNIYLKSERPLYKLNTLEESTNVINKGTFQYILLLKKCKNS